MASVLNWKERLGAEEEDWLVAAGSVYSSMRFALFERR
jgi:hypothetical protein